MATAKKPLAGLGKKVAASSQGYSYTPPSPVKTPAQIEATQKREAYDKALAADIRKVESWQPVTTYEQAVAFGNSEIGKRIPDMDKWLYNLEYFYYNYGNAKPATQERVLNYYLGLVNEAKTNLPQAMERGLSTAVQNYLLAVRAYNIDPHVYVANSLTRYTNELNDAVKLAVEVGVSPQNILKSLEVGQKEYTEGINRMIADLNKSDQIWGIAENLILGGLTGALSPINATLLNSAIALENKVPFKDVLKGAISNLAGNEVVSYLQGIQAITKDPVVNSAVSNSLRSALSAQALKQDVKTAALAGFAGGAAAGTLLKASDNAAISRAAGEYVQSISAGMSPEAALMNAVSGFADEEMAEARSKILAKAGQDKNKVDTKTSDSDQPTGDTKTAARDQVIEAFEESASQPKTLGGGTKVAALESIDGTPLGKVVPGAGPATDEPLFPGGAYNVGVNQKAGPIRQENIAGKNVLARDITDAGGDTTTYYFDPVDKEITARFMGQEKGLTVTAGLDKPSTAEETKSHVLERILEQPPTTPVPTGDKVVTPELPAPSKPTTADVADTSIVLKPPVTQPTSGAVSTPTLPDVKLPDTKLPDISTSTGTGAAVTTPTGGTTTGGVTAPTGTTPTDVSAPTSGATTTTAGAGQAGAGQVGGAGQGAGTGQAAGTSDLDALKALQAQEAASNLKAKLGQAKAAANDALVALQFENTPETVKAAQDALANYELSKKMYDESPDTGFTQDEKLASQEFPLVDQALQTGYMLGLSNVMPMTPQQRYQQYQRLAGQKGEEEESYLGDTGLGIAVLPRFEGLLQPQMFYKGGLATLKRM